MQPCQILLKTIHFTQFSITFQTFFIRILTVVVLQGKQSRMQEAIVVGLAYLGVQMFTLTFSTKLQLKSWNYGHNKMSITGKISKIFKKFLWISIQK